MKLRPSAAHVPATAPLVQDAGDLRARRREAGRPRASPTTGPARQRTPGRGRTSARRPGSTSETGEQWRVMGGSSGNDAGSRFYAKRKITPGIIFRLTERPPALRIYLARYIFRERHMTRPPSPMSPHLLSDPPGAGRSRPARARHHAGSARAHGRRHAPVAGHALPQPAEAGAGGADRGRPPGPAEPMGPAARVSSGSRRPAAAPAPPKPAGCRRLLTPPERRICSRRGGPDPDARAIVLAGALSRALHAPAAARSSSAAAGAELAWAADACIARERARFGARRRRRWPGSVSSSRPSGHGDQAPVAGGPLCHLERPGDAASLLEAFMDSFLKDLRYAIRALRRQPTFTSDHHADARARHRRQHRHLQRRQRRHAAAAAVSAAGTARVHHEPVPEPRASTSSGCRCRSSSSSATNNRSFESVGAYRSARSTRTSNPPRRPSPALVTPELMPTLGVPPLRGRWFTRRTRCPTPPPWRSSRASCGRARSAATQAIVGQHVHDRRRRDTRRRHHAARATTSTISGSRSGCR